MQETEARRNKMNTLTTKLIAAGILFLFTLISGVIVSHSGRPPSVALVTLHKLIAVATVVLFGMTVNQLVKTGDAQVFVKLSVVVVTGVLFVILVATGALLTRDMQLPEAILKVHQVAPLLALVSSTTTIYLLARVNS
jgi:hypothetical protein